MNNIGKIDFHDIHKDEVKESYFVTNKDIKRALDEGKTEIITSSELTNLENEVDGLVDDVDTIPELKNLRKTLKNDIIRENNFLDGSKRNLDHILSKLNKVDKKVAKTKYENNFDRANSVDNKITFLQAKADELQTAIARMEDLLRQKREIYKELRSHKTKKEIKEKSHLISYEKRVNNLAEQQGKVTLNLYNLQNDIKKVGGINFPYFPVNLSIKHENNISKQNSNEGQNIILSNGQKVNIQGSNSEIYTIDSKGIKVVKEKNYSDVSQAFAEGGVIGALDYWGKSTNMTKGQRDFWKGAANLGAIAGGVYLGYQAISSISNIYFSDKKEDKNKGRLTLAGVGVGTVALQAYTGKGPIEVFKELFSGGTTTKKIMGYINGDECSKDFKEEVSYPLRTATLFCRPMTFADILQYNLITIDSTGKMNANFDALNLYITTNPTIDQNIKQIALNEITVMRKNPELVNEGLVKMGINAAVLQNGQNGNKTVAEYYEQHIKSIKEKADADKGWTGVDVLGIGQELDKLPSSVSKQKKDALVKEAHILYHKMETPVKYEVGTDGKLYLLTYGLKTEINFDKSQVGESKLENKIYYTSVEEMVRVANLENFIKNRFTAKSNLDKPFHLSNILGDIEFSEVGYTTDPSKILDNVTPDTRVVSGWFWGSLPEISSHLYSSKDDYINYLNSLGVWKNQSSTETSVNGSVVNGLGVNSVPNTQDQTKDGENKKTPENGTNSTKTIEDLKKEAATLEAQNAEVFAKKFLEAKNSVLRMFGDKPIKIEQTPGSVNAVISVGNEQINVNLMEKTINGAKYYYNEKITDIASGKLNIKFADQKELMKSAVFTGILINQYKKTSDSEAGFESGTARGLFNDMVFNKENGRVVDTESVNVPEGSLSTFSPSIAANKETYLKRLNDMYIWRKE